MTFNLSGIQKLLHSAGKSGTDTALQSLSHSSIGTSTENALTTNPASALDSFSLTTSISKLLSPACGMSDEEKASYLAHIEAKLKSGKKLTAEEMRFLQAEYPDLYLQAARVQSMRESMEQQLKSCNTKEEAASVFSTSVSMVSDKDPMKEAITAAYQDAYDKFRQTGDYQKLPANEKEKEKRTLND